VLEVESSNVLSFVDEDDLGAGFAPRKQVRVVLEQTGENDDPEKNETIYIFVFKL
jgi:hypothetical protein